MVSERIKRMCYVLNKNMKIEPPSSTRILRYDPDLPPVAQVVMDTFSDLWIQYEDGRWCWVSLIGLIDKKPFRSLMRHDIFRRGTLSSDRHWIEWSSSLRLHVDHLKGSVGILTPKGIVVRAAGETAYGWFRPLLNWHPKLVRRQRLMDSLMRQTVNDEQILRRLGWSDEMLEAVYGAYDTGAEAVAARLLDLVLYLGGLNSVEDTKHQRWLMQSWTYPEYTTPWEAIQAGDIALIEHMYLTDSPRKRNFTTQS